MAADQSDGQRQNIGLYVSMALYMLALVAVAYMAWRRKRSAALKAEAVSAQYGGSFSAPLLILTTFSSVFSGYTISGVPSEAALKGFFAVRWIPAVMAAALGMLAYYPRLRRISVERGYTSPNDFITDRYGSPVLRVVCSLCACLPQYFYLTVQFVSFAGLLSGFTLGAVPKLAGMILFAAIVLAMEKLGGMNSVVLSDAVQAVLMILGFIAMLGALTAHYGTLPALQPAGCASLGYVNQTALDALEALGDLTSAPAACQPQGAGPECEAYGCAAAARPEFFEYPSRGDQAAFLFFVLNFLAFPLNPHMVQRAYIASSDDALRLVVMVLLVAGFLTFPPGILAGIVSATFGASWPLSSQSATTFAAIGSELMRKGPFEYALVAVLTCSALAAVMSTADSVILGVANTLSVDVFQRTLRPGATPSQVVRFGLGVTIVFLLAGIVGGTFIKTSQFGTLLTLQNGILLQIFPAYTLGLYLDVSTRAVTAGVFTGILVFFAALAYNPLAPFVPPPNIGAFANVVAVAAVQLLAPGTDEPAATQFGPRLTAKEIRKLMQGTGEPSRPCLLLVLVGLLASTPVYGSPGAQEPSVMGFPRWAFVVLLLQVACAVLGLAAARSWRPGLVIGKARCEAEQAVAWPGHGEEPWTQQEQPGADAAPTQLKGAAEEAVKEARSPKVECEGQAAEPWPLQDLEAIDVAGSTGLGEAQCYEESADLHSTKQGRVQPVLDPPPLATRAPRPLASPPRGVLCCVFLRGGAVD